MGRTGKGGKGEGEEEEGGANGNFEKSELGSEVEWGIAVVGDIGGVQGAGVVFDDAFEEDEVVEVDGAAETGGKVDHRNSIYLGRFKKRVSI